MGLCCFYQGTRAGTLSKAKITLSTKQLDTYSLLILNLQVEQEFAESVTWCPGGL